METPRKPSRLARDAEADVLPIGHTSNRTGTEELVKQIKSTADGLARDQATRGDLKLLSRALRELRYAFSVFKPYRRQRKVSVFGSARTPPGTPAYVHARRFGDMMAEDDWMVLTGAGGGIMEAANVGAGPEASMGVNIMLPFEQEPNRVVRNDEKLVYLKYFFTRKLLFVKEVHAVALFPGGFGTLDEAFEVLTLVQTGKRDLMPIVMIDEPNGTYWKQWQEFVHEELFKAELISPEDSSLYKITSDLDDAVAEITNFYSVYNSMRYVRGRLVIRLHVAPGDALLERLNDEFCDICTKGAITPVETHAYESDDSHLRNLPRIGLSFDRRQVGRLRQMVDLINYELRDEARERRIEAESLDGDGG